MNYALTDRRCQDQTTMFDQRPPAFVLTFDVRCVNVPFALERLPVCLNYLNGMRLCRLLMSKFVCADSSSSHNSSQTRVQ